MRKSARIAALVAGPIMVLGIGAATAAPAFASTGTSNSVNNITKITGNKAISYDDPSFGGVKCNETRHPAFDTVSCKFTAGQLQTPLFASSVGWNSDIAGSTHTTGTLTYTINADGTGYSGQATYPNG